MLADPMPSQPPWNTHVFVPHDLPGARVAGNLTLEVHVLRLGDGASSQVHAQPKLHPRLDCEKRTRGKLTEWRDKD